MLGRKILPVLSLFVVAGCLVEPVQERAPGSGDEVDAPRSMPIRERAGECLARGGLGCFDGHVGAKADFSVEGRAFFNADDLAARFCELIATEVDGVAGNACQLADLQMDSRLDGQHFLTDFEYYVQGAISRSGKVKPSGNFSIQDLPEGNYMLRVQRPIRFAMMRSEGLAIAMPEGMPAPVVAAGPATPSARQLCATLYADVEVEISREKRVWDIFKEFKLHVAERDCAASQTRAQIPL